ncbi:hypothetical protein [Thalassobacillus sp. CUG 92003]|uniref:hypothetical protein n=1 Tax=Thalassobacillus sp. CUG 92003 TaxID=2736641 RepID=UPI0015E7DE5B|nr:hypothetical protein [Thalassobacillus sp. CUG 92003]
MKNNFAQNLGNEKGAALPLTISLSALILSAVMFSLQQYANNRTATMLHHEHYKLLTLFQVSETLLKEEINGTTPLPPQGSRSYTLPYGRSNITFEMKNDGVYVFSYTLTTNQDTVNQIVLTYSFSEQQ